MCKKVVVQKNIEKIIIGSTNVYKHLKSKYNTRGDKNFIINELKALITGQEFYYNKTSIKKISIIKFKVVNIFPYKKNK